MEGRALPRLVYIAGVPRSGSTLIERLLGQLPGWCAVGELVYLWQRGIVNQDQCACGQPFRECPFWNEVGSVAFGGWNQVDVTRVAELGAAVDRVRFIPSLLAPSLRPSFRRRLNEYLSYWAKLYHGIGVVSDCEVVVDSSKILSFAFCLDACAQLDLRVIHIVRDSRAVAYSWTRATAKRRETTVARDMRTIAGAAWQWDHENGAVAVLAKSGTPTLRVRYEDLVTAPEATLTQIAGFTGLPAGNGGLDVVRGDMTGRWADVSVSHGMGGNPKRVASGRIPIRIDDEWRTAMPAAQRRTVTALTLPLLRHYGYPGTLGSRGPGRRV